jgi:hypothetical protein
MMVAGRVCEAAAMRLGRWTGRGRVGVGRRQSRLLGVWPQGDANRVPVCARPPARYNIVFKRNNTIHRWGGRRGRRGLWSWLPMRRWMGSHGPGAGMSARWIGPVDWNWWTGTDWEGHACMPPVCGCPSARGRDRVSVGVWASEGRGGREEPAQDSEDEDKKKEPCI